MNKIQALLLFILFSGLLLSGCSKGIQSDLGRDPDFIKAKKILAYHASKYDKMDATGNLENGVRTIHIKAYQFHFDPNLIIVNKGEKLRLIIEAMDVPHGFEIEGLNIPDYDINTKIRKGTPLVLEFTTDEKGVWEFICTIYCGFGHSTMKGTFVVR